MTSGPRTAPVPAVVRRRLDRFRPGGLATSFLSVGAAASLASVGFEAIGEVMGGSVRQSNGITYGASCAKVGLPSGEGYRHTPALGRASYHAGTPRPYQFGHDVVLGSGRYSPQRVRLETINAGYSSALARLVAEARALGADGVVGVRVTRARRDEVLEEFTMLGTAVRARGSSHPQTPFTTELDGPDVARLLLGGWTPVGLQICVERAIRHNGDYSLVNQTRRRGPNVEVGAYTDLVIRARDSVRDKLRRSIARIGADGGVISRLDSSSWDQECDRVVEVVVHGTAISRFGGPRRTPRPAPLTVMPLTGSTRR